MEIHIPRGSKLTPSECEASLNRAREFFATYFPDFSYTCFTCNSWLLDDTLAAILPGSSNILRFQRRFTPVSKVPSDVIAGFVFRWKAGRQQALALPADTSLKKAIHERFRSGGAFYVALGYIPRTE